MNTIAALKSKFPVGNLDHLLEDIEIPVLTGANAQGDLSWYPDLSSKATNFQPIPSGGEIILSGNNGHPHTLFSMSGECLLSRNPSAQEQQLGTVVVPEGGLLLVGHNEHGYHIIGEGTYIFNRSREMRDEIILLAD